MSTRTASRFRRPKGTGTAYQDKKSGQWVAERTVAGKRIRRKGTTATEALARVERALATQTAAGENSEETPLADYLRRWLSGKKDLRPKTRHGYRHLLETYVIPLLGDLPVGEVQPRHVMMVLRSMSDAGLSASTRRNARNALSSALQDAVQEEHIAGFNPARGLRIPTADSRASQIRVSWTDARRFLDDLYDHRDYRLWALSLYLVRRIGEMVALRWEDFPIERSPSGHEYPRFREQTIFLRRNWSQSEDAEGNLYADFGRIKTKAGERQIPIPEEAVPLLFKHWRAMGKPSRGLLFPSRTNPDRPISPAWTLRMMKAHLREKGWEKDEIPRQHDLRHWGISLLLSKGVPLPTVSALAGHANPEVTARLYAHVLQEATKEAANELRFWPEGHKPPKVVYAA